MRHLLSLCLSLYASWAFAQPGKDPSVAEARQRCAQLKARFQILRSLPGTEPRKTERESAFQELLKLHGEARKVHVARATRLADVPDPRTREAGLEAMPIHELAVVAECGGGWSLTSLRVQFHENGAESLDTGYIETRLLLEGPASCASVTSWVQLAPYRQSVSTQAPVDALYVTGSAVMVRDAPSPEATVLQKLGYGVAVNAVSRACDDWILVSSPFGGHGFVHKDLLGATLHDEATLRAKQAQASSVLEQSVWALARAHFFPSESNRSEALALQTKARAALRGSDQGRCDNFVGVCAVLLEDSLRPEQRLEPELLGQVPVGPWWVLTTADSAAQPAVFRGAHVYSSGECNCCGCETCQTNLRIVFEPLGTRESTGYLAASRRPPPSWFRSLSREDCAAAERAAKKSPKWDVPLYGGEAGKPATPGEGTCIPGDDGSVWWQQVWNHPEMADMENDQVLRTYRVLKGRVVEVGKLTVMAADSRPLAWTTPSIVAWRDLDGDGRPDAIVPCPFGGYCTQAKGFTR